MMSANFLQRSLKRNKRKKTVYQVFFRCISVISVHNCNNKHSLLKYSVYKDLKSKKHVFQPFHVMWSFINIIPRNTYFQHFIFHYATVLTYNSTISYISTKKSLFLFIQTILTWLTFQTVHTRTKSENRKIVQQKLFILC